QPTVTDSFRRRDVHWRSRRGRRGRWRRWHGHRRGFLDDNRRRRLRWWSRRRLDLLDHLRWRLFRRLRWRWRRWRRRRRRLDDLDGHLVVDFLLWRFRWCRGRAQQGDRKHMHGKRTRQGGDPAPVEWIWFGLVDV